MSKPSLAPGTVSVSVEKEATKLHTLVYDILPPITAIADDAIGVVLKNEQLTNSFSMMLKDGSNSFVTDISNYIRCFFYNFF